MKYDLNSKTNRFAQRTLTAFSDVLFRLLRQKSFEAVTVNELCETANYPRATFYNYFDDIYDLLEYCWYLMSIEVKIDDYSEMKPEERITIIFDRLYDFLDSQSSALNRILKHNKPDGKLIGSLNRYMRTQIRNIMSNCTCTERYTIPYEIVAEHYGNTLMLVLEWSFLETHKMSKEEAQRCIEYLLKGI